MTRHHALLACLALCALARRTWAMQDGGDASRVYECFNKVRGASDDHYDTVVGCLNGLVANNLRQLDSATHAKLKLFGSVVELERTKTAVTSDRSSPKQFVNATDPETVLDNNVADGLDNLTKNFAIKVRLVEGVKLRLSRGIADALSVGLVFEGLDDDYGDDDDDDEDDDEVEEEDDDEEYDEEELVGRQARAGGGLVPGGGGGGDSGGGGTGGGLQNAGGVGGGNKKKKKKKSSVKKKDKEFKEKLPMLLIPFIIQAIILPLFLANLKLIALKSIVVGKITLFLVAYNYLRRLSHRKKEDNELEHIAVNHYGFNGDMEYGAFINRRSL